MDEEANRSFSDRSIRGGKKALKLPTLLLALALIAACLCVCAAESREGGDAEAYSYDAGVENLSDHGIDLDEMLEEFQETNHSGFSGFWLPRDPDDRPTFYLFDVTGDGCVDLCTCKMFGSGMVRTHTIVFDPLNHERHLLDGYDYDYVINGVTDGHLVIVKRGPNGYGDPITETFGTAVLEDGQLVFVPD